MLCLKQLVNAAKDNDFAGLREDARFKQLTDGVVVKEPDYRAAARRVLKALVRGDSSPAVESVKAGRAVLYASTWEDMSGGEDKPETSYNLVKTLAAANAFSEPIRANEVPYPFTAGKLGRCKGNCCSVAQEGGQNIQDIDKLCFWPVSADKAVLISLSVTLCGS